MIRSQLGTHQYDSPTLNARAGGGRPGDTRFFGRPRMDSARQWCQTYPFPAHSTRAHVPDITSKTYTIHGYSTPAAAGPPRRCILELCALTEAATPTSRSGDSASAPIQSTLAWPDNEGFVLFRVGFAGIG